MGKKFGHTSSLFVSSPKNFFHREEEEESKKIERKIKKKQNVLGPWWP